MITMAEAVWWEADSGEWTHKSGESDPSAIGALNILTFALPHDLRKSREAILDAVDKGEDNEWITGGEGPNVAFENGMCVMTHNYFEDQQAIVHPDELIKLIDWRIAIMESPDFKNPNAQFDPIEIEYQEIE